MAAGGCWRQAEKNLSGLAALGVPCAPCGRGCAEKWGGLISAGSIYFGVLVHLSDAQPVPAGVGGTGAGKRSLMCPSLGVQPVLETSQVTGHEGLVQSRPLHWRPIGVEAGVGEDINVVLCPRDVQLRDWPCLAWLSSKCSWLCAGKCPHGLCRPDTLSSRRIMWQYQAARPTRGLGLPMAGITRGQHV